MRIERIRVGRFGRLEGFDSGELGPFVAVHGPNEAGKSTLFEFVVALLYGFYPASRDTNPWAPWDEAAASGSALLRLADGSVAEVERRLMSSPSGSLIRGAREEALRNQTLPWAAHVPIGVFRQVFALRLSELAALESEGWDALQDRLVSALGARDLRSARGVADQLEREAGALWRTSRRGNQRVRELGERIRELRLRRADVRDAERRVREASADLAAARATLEELRAERNRVREALEKERRAAPLRRDARRLAALRVEAGDPRELEGLPTDPVHALEASREREAEVAGKVQTLRAERDALVIGQPVLDPAEAAALERGPCVEDLVAKARATEGDRRRLTELEGEIGELERRLREALARLPGSPDDPAGAREISIPELAAAVDDLRNAARAPTPAAPPAPVFPARVLVAAAVFGGVALVFGMVLGVPWLAGAGGVLAAAAVVLALGSRAAPVTGPDPEAARARVVEALGGWVRLPPDELPPADLARTVERVRDLDRDLARALGTRAALAHGAERIEQALRAEAAQVGLTPAADTAGEALAHRLAGVLERARERARALELAEAEATRCRRLLADAERELEEARAARRRVEELLASLGGPDPDENARRAARRLRAAERARELEAELGPAAGLADAEPAAEGEADGARLAAREHALGEEVERLAGQVRGLEAELGHLGGRTTLDDIDGEIAVLDAERERLRRKRDRLWVIARVVRDADRWVREEHQPELLRRAGSFLAVLTGGRYDRILVGGEGERGFLLRGPALPRPVPVGPPLSTATREQVYLALRLALLDPLDGAGERLPLVLDEVFVNWDATRRDRGLELVRRTSAERQVLLFTCHEPMIEAAAAAGANVLRLDPP